jgi:hypothetical protein
MRPSIQKLLTVCLLPLAALGAALAPAPARAEEQVIAIVVDRDNPRSDIGVEELRSLYLGKRHEWSDRTRAVPIDLDSGAPRSAFCATVLRMTEAEYERYWVDQKVRGAGTGPRSVSSPGLAIRLVARVRGAVGYVPLSRVDGSVKVLTVGGVRPGQPGYPLIGVAGLAEEAFSESLASSDARDLGQPGATTRARRSEHSSRG